MTSSSDRLDRIERIVAKNSEDISALAGHTLSIRQDLSELVSIISATARLTQSNATAIQELRESIRELRAGQDENRAILNQILRRDQERGS